LVIGGAYFVVGGTGTACYRSIRFILICRLACEAAGWTRKTGGVIGKVSSCDLCECQVLSIIAGWSSNTASFELIETECAAIAYLSWWGNRVVNVTKLAVFSTGTAELLSNCVEVGNLSCWALLVALVICIPSEIVSAT